MAGLKNKKSSKTDIAAKYKQQLGKIKELKHTLAINSYFNSLNDLVAPSDANAYKK